MASQLFAFNVAQEVPRTEIVEVTGTYDDQQQVWVGADGVALCDTFWSGTEYCSYSTRVECCGGYWVRVCWWNDTKSDGDCD